MNEQEFINVILSLLSLGSLLYLWKKYRELQIDKCRHKLFVIRDELFDKAIEGELSFDQRSYQLTRNFINNCIRMNHKISFLDVFLSRYMRGKSSWQIEFEEETKKLSKVQKEIVADTMTEASKVILHSLVDRSILLVCIQLIVYKIIIVWLLYRVFKLSIDFTTRKISELTERIKNMIFVSPQNS